MLRPTLLSMSHSSHAYYALPLPRDSGQESSTDIVEDGLYTLLVADFEPITNGRIPGCAKNPNPLWI